MVTWLEDISDAITALGGTGTLADIYGEVERRRSALPPTWKDVIRRQIQNHSSDSAGYKGGSDMYFSVRGLHQGVWGLRSAVAPTPVAVDIDKGSTAPQRTQQTTYRILRDTVLSRQIKLLHRNRCQLCDVSLQISPTRAYSEAHHIIPLGGVHAGPDTAENIIVLCPNHHALCDYGAIRLDVKSIREVAGHRISPLSIRYHNLSIFGQRT